MKAHPQSLQKQAAALVNKQELAKDSSKNQSSEYCLSARAFTDSCWVEKPKGFDFVIIGQSCLTVPLQLNVKKSNIECLLNMKNSNILKLLIILQSFS